MKRILYLQNRLLLSESVLFHFWSEQNGHKNIAQKCRKNLLLKDGCRRELMHHWPFHAGYVQCGWRTSYGKPAQLCRPVGFCNVREQPGWIPKYIYLGRLNHTDGLAVIKVWNLSWEEDVSFKQDIQRKLPQPKVSQIPNPKEIPSSFLTTYKWRFHMTFTII